MFMILQIMCFPLGRRQSMNIKVFTIASLMALTAAAPLPAQERWYLQHYGREVCVPLDSNDIQTMTREVAHNGRGWYQENQATTPQAWAKLSSSIGMTVHRFLQKPGIIVYVLNDPNYGPTYYAFFDDKDLCTVSSQNWN